VKAEEEAAKKEAEMAKPETQREDIAGTQSGAIHLSRIPMIA
jgi:hypothetical protein